MNVDYGIWGSKAGINPPGGFVGPVLVSSASMTITHPIHHVSGTESVTTIVPPFTGFVGTITLIADAAFTMTTGGTSGSAIGTAVTMVAGQAIDMVHDGAAWYPKIAD